jgi:HK97 family phage major capsid protein
MKFTTHSRAVDRQLTHTEAVDRIASIHQEMETLAEKQHLSRSDGLRSAALTVEADECNQWRLELVRRQDLAKPSRGGRYKLEGEGSGVQSYEDDRDDQQRGGLDGGLRNKAMQTLDRHVSAGSLPAEGAEIVEGLLRTGGERSQTWTARWAAATGSDDYMRAFAKLVANPTHGHLRWTAQESESFRVVEQLRDSTRDMGLTDSLGGYLVPLTIDPSVMITSAGSINPLRQISRVVTIATESYRGVSSSGVSAEFKSEGAEASDASPTLAQPTIPVYLGEAFVPFSFEIAMDGMGFMDELAKLLFDGAEQLNNLKYTLGSGTGEPTGVISSLVATGGSVIVDSAVTDTFGKADVYALQNALAPRFSANAQWCANLATINAMRQMETTNGNLQFPELSNDPSMLLGRRINELSNMDGTITSSAENYVLLYGDFQAGNTIVQRLGSTLEIIPNLVGANRRPTAERGALLWWRTGSNVVVPQALKLLDVT